MAADRKDAPDGGSFRPQDLADPAKHQQSQIFEQDNRPQLNDPAAKDSAEKRFERDEDMIAQGEQEVGEAPGPDTAGVVAPPAERGRPGASTKLDGTPGALATPSGGRDTDY
jgi:hypothetical protein